MEKDNSYIDLFTRNQKLVYSFINNHKNWIRFYDSQEDMIQELSLALWKSLPKYKKDLGGLSTFVNIVLTNACKMAIKKANMQKRKVVIVNNIINVKGIEKDIFDTIVDEDSEYKIFVNMILTEMPEILKDYFIEEKTLRELGKKYKISHEWARSVIDKEIKKMKNLYNVDKNQQ